MSKNLPNNIKIRLGEPQDRNQIFQIQIESIQILNSSDYDTRQIKALIDKKRLLYSLENKWGDVVFVAEAEDAIIGFSALSADWINAVFVHPAYIRQGVATKLLQALEEAAISRNIKRISVMSSLTAQPFYQACGYTIITRSFVIAIAGVRIPCFYMDKWLVTPSEEEKFLADCTTSIIQVGQWLLTAIFP